MLCSLLKISCYMLGYLRKMPMILKSSLSMMYSLCYSIKMIFLCEGAILGLGAIWVLKGTEKHTVCTPFDTFLYFLFE